MKGTLTIKDQTIDLACNALTPILYRQIFKKDFLNEITAFKALKGKKPTEYTDADIELVTNRSEAFTRLAFIMAKEAELKDAQKLVSLTLVDYYAWLMDFDATAFSNPQVFSTILNLWLGNTDSKVEGKNADRRE